MKILSLWEPWASLMAIGAKRIETRSWSTPYRGWLAIHAAKRWTFDERMYAESEPFVSSCLGANWKPALGCIVAVAKLIEMVPTDMIHRGYHPITEQERAFGNYEPGRYGWVTTSAFRLPQPIPLHGQQGAVGRVG